MSFSTVQKIRFDDVDGAGIVYYPRFFHICHKAFEDFFDEKGPITYPKLISDWKRGFPTVKTEGNYTAPLKYGDSAKIELTIEHIGKSSVRTRYLVSRARDNVIAFEGLVTNVCVDLADFRPTPIEGDLHTFLKAYMKETS